MSISEKELSTKEIVRRLSEVIILELNAGRTNCVLCEHFTLETEICKIANVRPPAKVIVHGCSSFSEVVPF